MNDLSLRRRWWIAVALVALFAGCGGRVKIVPVSGQVLIDGKPVTAGTVEVVPADAKAAFGKLDAQGRFTLTTVEEGDGCVPGTHAVAVKATATVGNEMRFLVPEKCANASTSGVSVTIDGPTDSLEIKLSWEGEEPTVIEVENEGDFDPTAQ